MALRFLRIFVLILTGLSALLGLVVVAAWADSYSTADVYGPHFISHPSSNSRHYFRWRSAPTGDWPSTTQTTQVLASARGRVYFSLVTFHLIDVGDTGTPFSRYCSPYPVRPRGFSTWGWLKSVTGFEYSFPAAASGSVQARSFALLGFRYGFQGTKSRTDYLDITVPHWHLAVLFALPPFVMALARLARCRRMGSTTCPTCAYDLRAHRPGDRCPECGSRGVARDQPA